ncbi:MAG: hypothetical protein NDJ89_13205 [Oligoflexia bacterium]|nr:hypothetical protein [Oligoflexia bacterium]
MIAFIALVLFAQNAAHADSFYEERNGKRYYCKQVGSAPALPSCTAECQHFDTFNNVCDYQSTCEYNGDCVRAKVCDVFDTSDRICRTEKSTLTCASDRGSISCVAQCQRYDSYSQTCLYQSSCTENGNCIVSKTCDRWDSFNNICLSEKSVTTCR